VYMNCVHMRIGARPEGEQEGGRNKLVNVDLDAQAHTHKFANTIRSACPLNCTQHLAVTNKHVIGVIGTYLRIEAMYATMAAHAALLMLLVEGKENTALHNTCIYTWTDVDVRAAAGGLVGSTKEQAAHRLAGL